MESKYRIKQAALPFFDPKYATKINTKEYWINEHVSEFAIEQVEDCYVSYGISKGENMASLSGFHGSEQSCYFDFTLHFNGIDYNQYNYLNTDEKIRGLMEQLQAVGNEFFNKNRLF
jgi:hypothetical protein